MAEDRISSYIDREGVSGDTAFILKEINQVYESFKKVNSLKIDLSASKSLREAAVAAKGMSDEILKTKGSVDSLNKSYVNSTTTEHTKNVTIQKDAYATLTKEVKEAEKAARIMAAEFGVQSEQALKAAASAIELKTRLAEVNSVTKPKKEEAQGPIPFTTNLDALEKEKLAIKATGDAVNELNEAEAQASNTAVAWGQSQLEAGDNASEAASDFIAIKSELDKYTGTLQKNVTAQIENKNSLIGIKKEQKDIETQIKAAGGATDNQVKKLAELKQQSSLLEEANKSLSVTIRNQIKDFTSADGSIDSLQSKTNLLQQAYEQLGDAERASPFGKELKAEIDKLEPKVKALEGTIGKFGRNVGNYSGAVKTLEKALGDVRVKLDAYSKSGKVSADAIAMLTKEEGILTSLVNAQVNGFASATAELRNNEKALQQLGAAGLQQTAFYKELLQETANLRDGVSDLKVELKNLGSDTKSIDGLVQGAQTLVGAYGIAQGAAALFGEENEELQKTFVKLQAVQTILAGLQGIQNALQKESSVVLLLNSVRTKALTAAQTLYTFATGGATVATNVFRTALLATGIGAILVLISTAAQAMTSFGDSTEDTTKDIDNLADALKNLNTATDESIKSIQRTTKLAIEYAKQRGASEKEINAIVLDSLEAEAVQYENLSKRKIEANRKFFKDEVELTINTSQDAQEALDIINTQKARGEFNKLDEFQKNNLDAAVNSLTEIVTSANNAQDKIDEVRQKSAEFDTGETEKQRDSAKKSGEDRVARAKEYAERERKAQFELLKLTIQDKIDADKELSNSGLLGLSGRIEARARAFEQERVLVIAERDFALQSSKLTTTEREVITKESANKLRAIEQQTADDIIAIRNSITDQQKAAQAEILNNAKDIQDAQIAGDTERSLRTFEASISRLEEQADAEEKANVSKYTKGLISKEQYETNKLAIENKFRRESLLAEIKYNEELLLLVDLSPELKLDAEKKLNDLKRKLRSDDLHDAINDKDKRIDIEKERNEKLKELANELKDTVFSLMGSGIDREKNAIQDTINTLDAKKAKDIEVANQAIGSATERAAAIAIIEARAAAQKEALELKQRKLDEQKAKFERIKNIAEIIGNTARGVAASLPNIPLALIVGAIGALQLVRAIAAPIPKFFAGKDKHNQYEGFGIVDDGGKPEAIIREGGNIEIGTNRPRITYLKKNDIVLPDARQLADMQFKLAIDATGKLIHGYNPAPQNNNEKLEKAVQQMSNNVVRAINSKPVPGVIVQNPVKQWVRSGENIMDFLNRYR